MGAGCVDRGQPTSAGQGSCGMDSGSTTKGGGAASQACGSVSLPPDAARVGAAVGGMDGEDLGLPGLDGAGQARQLGHTDTVCPAVEVLQPLLGIVGAVGGVDRPQQLLALPGRGRLTTRVTGGKAGPQPSPSPLGELLGSGQQQLAMRYCGSGLRPRWPGWPAGRVGGPGRPLCWPPDGLKRSTTTVASGSDATRAGVAGPGIQRDRGDVGQPATRPNTKPAVHRGALAGSFTTSSSSAALQVDQPR